MGGTLLQLSTGCTADANQLANTLSTVAHMQRYPRWYRPVDLPVRAGRSRKP